MITLAMLAKYWRPGMVKTRLAADLGAEQAASVHRAFVTTLAARFRSFGTQRYLWYTPHDSRSEFNTAAGPEWQCELQPDGDLGQRLAHCFQHHLQRADDRCLVIGADSPSLPRAYLAMAVQWLDEVPVVLGPTADGGYYMVAARTDVPSLFKGVPWGTDAVWSTTVAALQAQGIPFRELPHWYDVDRMPDLSKLCCELRQPEQSEAELVRLADQLCTILGHTDSTKTK